MRSIKVTTALLLIAATIMTGQIFRRVSANCDVGFLASTGTATCTMDAECIDGDTFFMWSSSSASAINCQPVAYLEAHGWSISSTTRIYTSSYVTYGSIYGGQRWMDCNGNGALLSRTFVAA